jgi:hypothetical protein
MTNALDKPVAIDIWKDANRPEETLKYHDGFYSQIRIIQDKIVSQFLLNEFPYNTSKDYTEVISTHTSKSVKLPVFWIDLTKIYGISFTIRGNFHDWKISVDSKYPIEPNFLNIFKPDREYASCYCEGFPDDKVFGSYSNSNTKFTVEVNNDWDLYTFFLIMNDYIRKIKQLQIKSCGCHICMIYDTVDHMIDKLKQGNKIEAGKYGKTVYSFDPVSKDFIRKGTMGDPRHNNEKKTREDLLYHMQSEDPYELI